MLNEDRMQASRGFVTQPQRDIEIIFYVVADDCVFLPLPQDLRRF